MKYSVSEIAHITGISVRTLHYYDEIGLLLPSVTSENGYRYYDDSLLEKLQQILFYRELDFSLKSISEILNASDYKKEYALKKQRELLIMKRTRLDGLIALINANLKGDNTMSFKEFDMSELEAAKASYAEEVQAKWGQTTAYAQNKSKTEKYSKEDWGNVMEKSDAIMKKFADNIDKEPASDAVQALVEEWRSFITEYYYECTIDILAGLADMYIADERFMQNIDKFGVGTAQLMSDAIKVYCAK